MKTEKVPVSAIARHPMYIRTKTDQQHIDIMFDFLKDQNETKKGVWPFPAVKLVPVPMTDEKEQRAGHRFYSVDGAHRIEAARTFGCDVEAEIHTGLSDIDIITLQLTSNAAHGMRLDFPARKRAIDALSMAGLKQVDITKRTGLGKWTVSRVLGNKEGTTGRPVAGTPAVPGKAPKKPWSLEKFTASLMRVTKEYEKHRTRIAKAKGYEKELIGALDIMVGQLLETDAEPEGKE
jgi:hypothetical protein